MGDHPVLLAVASYPSRSAAARDFQALWAVEHPGQLEHLAAAMVEKGDDGELEMNRHNSTAPNQGWLGELLGEALTVIAAPLGIRFLASRLATGTDWAGAGAIVGRFWYDIPKDQLRKMGNLLEDGQTALVMVAVDQRGEDIAALLSHATTMIVNDGTQVDFGADLGPPPANATPQSPTPSPAVDDEGTGPPML